MNESRFDEKCIRIPATISPATLFFFPPQSEKNSFIFALQMELHLRAGSINLLLASATLLSAAFYLLPPLYFVIATNRWSHCS